MISGSEGGVLVERVLNLKVRYRRSVTQIRRRAEGETSKTEHLGCRWNGKEGENGQSSGSDTGTEQDAPCCLHSCLQVAKCGSLERHKIGKCYPAIYGFCSHKRLSEVVGTDSS